VLSPSIPEDAEAPRTADFRLRSVNLAVDAALEAYPALPGERMAVLGHSFGGLAALEIAARSDRYRSYIAMSAPTDAFGFWGEFDSATRIQPEDGLRMRNQQGWAEAGQGKLGVPPWVDPESYLNFSPYLAAERITAPVLLINADFDYVPMSQAERVFSVLHRQGRQARLITYWGEHHTLWSPANIRDRYQQIMDWLSTTLAAPQGAATLAPDGLPRPAPSPRTPPPP
jgi:dipeptidyl aminopeptidase/acylaminoacyl peptidase